MMKKALKVTFGAILAVGTVGVAQANMNQIFDNIGVQVTGTYTKASNNGLSYGDAFVSNPVAGGGYRIGAPVFVDTDYEFDWGAGLAYGFSEHTSLYFNYDHFSDNANDNEVNVRNLGLAFPDAPNVGVTSTVGYGSVAHRTNEYELGLAHTWAQSPAFCIDYKAQLQWDKYERAFVEQVYDAAANFSTRLTGNKFTGFGPGVGLMAHARPLSHCPVFGVFAGGIASAMYGKNDFGVIALNQGGVIYGIDPETSHSVVAKVDIKFGVDWVNEFSWDGCKVPFGLALGMRYMNAINVFKNGNSYVEPIGIGAGQATAFTVDSGTANDFGRFGPFLQFNLGGLV